MMGSILDFSTSQDEQRGTVAAPVTFAEPDETLSFSERVKKAVDLHVAAGKTIAAVGRAIHPFTPVGIAQAIGTDLAERPGEFPTLFKAAESHARLVDNAFATDRAREEAYDRRIKAVKAATGVELPNPERGGYRLNERELRALTRDGPIDPAAYRRQRFDQDLSAAIADNPGKAGELQFGSIDAEAKAIAQGAEHDYEAARKDTRLSTASSLVTQLGGGLWGQRRDPIQVVALFAGPTSAVGRTVAARIASSGLFQGLYNAGISALEQPAVQAWRSELGLRSGVQPAAENVGLAFLFGAIPGAVFRGVHEIPAMLRPSVQRVLNGAPEAGDVEKAMQAARSALGEIDADMAEKVKAPAVRVGGKIYEDLNHGMAADKAEAELGRPFQLEEIESGFTTSAGRFVDRDEAALIANKVADLQSSDLPRRVIKLGDDIDEAARATAPARAKDVPPELHDDMTAAAQRHGEDQVNQPSSAAFAAVRDLEKMPPEIQERIAAAAPQTEREAAMAASEAIEDIGNRENIARTRVALDEERLPPPEPLPEGVKPPPASSKDPLDRIPLARDDGTPTVVSARQAARAGERETQFADLIRECK